MKARSIFAVALFASCTGAFAHDLTADIAKFNQISAGKKADSKEVVHARADVQRAQALMEQSEAKMLLEIRHLTNAGLKELGEPTSSLPNEIKRLETALANPKTSDRARIDKARQILSAVKEQLMVYDVVNGEAMDSMRQALKKIEAAPAK